MNPSKVLYWFITTNGIKIRSGNQGVGRAAILLGLQGTVYILLFPAFSSSLLFLACGSSLESPGLCFQTTSPLVLILLPPLHEDPCDQIHPTLVIQNNPFKTFTLISPVKFLLLWREIVLNFRDQDMAIFWEPLFCLAQAFPSLRDSANSFLARQGLKSLVLSDKGHEPHCCKTS